MEPLSRSPILVWRLGKPEQSYVELSQLLLPNGLIPTRSPRVGAGAVLNPDTLR
jgi:hypothetical protein